MYIKMAAVAGILDQVLNKTSVRQWSLTELIKRGYDANTRGSGSKARGIRKW